MSGRYLIILLLVFLQVCPPLFGQKKSNGVAQTDDSPQLTQTDLDQVLIEARRLAEEARGLESKDDEINYLVTLADWVWGRDQTFARRLLSRSFDLAVELLKVESTSKPNQKNKDPRLLFRKIALAAGKHDPKLETQLTESWGLSLSSVGDKSNGPNGQQSGSAELSFLLLQASTDILAKDEQRARLLFRQSVYNRVIPAHCYFLMNERQSSRELADSMFVDALGVLAQRQLYDANELLMLSSYLFSPNGNIVYLLVSGFNAANITGNVSGKPQNPTIARQYLTVLLNQLTPNDVIPTSVVYLALKNFLSQYQALAPELLDNVYAAIGRLAPNVPSEDSDRFDWVLKDRAASQINDSWEDRLKSDDKIEDEGIRNLAYVTLIRARLLPDKHFSKALEVAARISDHLVSEKMIDLINLTSLQARALAPQGTEALSDPDCERIKDPVLRVIAFGSLARSRLDHKSRNDLLHLLERASAEAKLITSDQDRLQAQLLVVQLYAAADSLDAFDAARSTVREINKVSDFNMRRSNFSLRFSVNGLPNELLLTSPASSLITTVQALCRLNWVQAIEICHLLEDRNTRLWAGLEGLRMWVDEANKKSQTKEASYE